MKSKLFRFLSVMVIITLISTLFIGCGNAEKKDPNVVKIGTNRALGTVTPLLAQKLGYFEGKDIKFEIVEFADGTSVMEAMAAGELDIAFCGIVPVATWVSKGIDMKVVASANGGGHVILAKEGNGINNVSDLPGHKLATPNVGTVTDVLLKSFVLKENNVNASAINIVSGMKPADMGTSMMVSGEIDSMLTYEPFASQTEKNFSGVKVISDVSKIWKEKTGKNNTYPVNVVCATQSFINNRPDDLKTILSAVRDTVNYINSDKSDEAIAQIAEILSLDKEIVKEASKRVEFTYEIDEDAINQMLKWAEELGYIKSVPNSSELIYRMEY